MINKIISGGQTGADQAALDVAIKLGIPHGGSIPRGRITENGTLDDKYKLEEMPTSNYNKRTEQNVIDADGTLIISHGKLTGGSDYTREMAIHHKRPFLHIDLNETFTFQAAERIRAWISEQGIGVLNVAGPRASKDPHIYRATADILETAFYMDIVHSTISDHATVDERRLLETAGRQFPNTVEQAVEKLLGKLSLRDKTMIANIPEENIIDLYNSLDESLQNELKSWLVRPELLASCRSKARLGRHDKIDVVSVILTALWHKLQETNVLRIVK